jgi:hypothetical protein
MTGLFVKREYETVCMEVVVAYIEQSLLSYPLLEGIKGN